MRSQRDACYERGIEGVKNILIEKVVLYSIQFQLISLITSG